MKGFKTSFYSENLNQTPFPSAYTEEELPDIFSDFFLTKISTIHDNLDLAASSSPPADSKDFRLVDVLWWSSDLYFRILFTSC